jgi:hypothetical protein
MALRLKEAMVQHCWDNNKGLLADTPEKRYFSQHANIFGLLTNAFPESLEKEVVECILKDTRLIKASLYFRYYLNEALYQKGVGNKYVDMLDPW